MTSSVKLCLIVVLASTTVQETVDAQSYTNPVIERIADAGVLRHAGKYYLGGVHTYGDFFISSDMINWDERVHVFDLDNQWTHGTGAMNNQIHADDISYSGGLFHLLFSVNYWGDDRHIVHITHATSPVVTGPYTEQRDDQWYENRIDPHVFCDEDGRLYLYMVKFTDGNTIWGRPLNADFSFAGDAVQQFASQPDTWERLDNRVAEGPFVVKYRGCYYMMYNANHTGATYGNYRLGVCEADSPLAFGPGGKYPYPVVSPQTEALEENHIDLIAWGTGEYNPVDLSADTIRFSLQKSNIKSNAFMKIAQTGNTLISLNGQPLNDGERNSYRLTAVDLRMLNDGDNTVTVTRPNKRSTLYALSLYDIDDGSDGDLLLTPGQPNIVRGPNGWEWWLVYMANKGWNRSQFIDRIHFTNSRLAVDGITGPLSDGFHPAPALPQLSGYDIDSLPHNLSKAFLLELTTRPSTTQPVAVIGGRAIMLPETMDCNVLHDWRIERNYASLTAWIDNVLVADHIPTDADDTSVSINGDIEYFSYNEGWDEYNSFFSGWDELTADEDGLSLTQGSHLKGDGAENYEFSVQLINQDLQNGHYGVYAAWKDRDNYVRVTVDAEHGTLVTEKCLKGKTVKEETPLAEAAVHYPDIKYSDTYEKQYRFDSDTRVSSIELPLTDTDKGHYADALSINNEGKRDEAHDVTGRLTYSWLDDDTWRPLNCTTAEQERPDWQRMTFEPVTTRALRMINKDPRDNSRNIYKIKVGHEIAASVQLRIEKRGDKLHIFVDNRAVSILTLKGSEATRVGLYSDGEADVRVANTLYYTVK